MSCILSECILVGRNLVKLTLVGRGLKSKFGGKPVIFFLMSKSVHNEILYTRVRNFEYESTAINDFIRSVQHRIQVLIVGAHCVDWSYRPYAIPHVIKRKTESGRNPDTTSPL